MTAYQELLRDPRWQRKRLQIFERDNWTCQRCSNSDEELQVHHLYYRYGRLPWEYPNSALTTRCFRCHQIEEFLKKIRDELRPLFLDGFTLDDILIIQETIIHRISITSPAEAQNYIHNIKTLIHL